MPLQRSYMQTLFRGSVTLDSSGASSYAVNIQDKTVFEDGTGTKQGDTIASVEGYVYDGDDFDLDLTNITVRSALGNQTVDMASVKAILIQNISDQHDDDPNLFFDIDVVNPTNPFDAMFGDPASLIPIAPGGFVAFCSPSIDGFAVASGEKVIRISARHAEFSSSSSSSSSSQSPSSSSSSSSSTSGSSSSNSSSSSQSSSSFSSASSPSSSSSSSSSDPAESSHSSSSSSSSSSGESNSSNSSSSSDSSATSASSDSSSSSSPTSATSDTSSSSSSSSSSSESTNSSSSSSSSPTGQAIHYRITLLGVAA